jgi:hypothetical protein
MLVRAEVGMKEVGMKEAGEGGGAVRIVQHKIHDSVN